MLAELLSDRGDVGEAGGVGQPVAVDVAQRLRTRRAAEVGDGSGAEIYDGLTPVTMTL